MDLNEYTEMLRRELGSVTRFGGDEFTRTAEMLADALESSVRLTLLEVLSAAAAEITTRLDGTVIDVRLSGGEPEFVVSTTPGEPAEEDFGRYPAPRRPAPPAAQASRLSQASGADPQAPGPQAVPPASFAAAAAADPTAPIPAQPDGQARGGPPAGNQTVVQLLPLPPQPGNAEPPDAPWWDSAQGGPPAPSPGAKRVPAPDLSTYLASTFIAQCPRCGAFRLDIRPARNGWDFHCEACEYTWTWQPGTPWPPVRVMPRGRKE